MSLAALTAAPGPPLSLDGIAAALSVDAAAIDRDVRFPHQQLALLAEAGFTGFTVPRRLGGAGQGIEAAADLLGRLAAAEPSSTLILAMTLIQQAIIARSERVPAAMRERIGRAGVAGGYLNALRVEPELGTPARGGLPATTATPAGSGWILDGHKRFSTGSHGLALGLVFARTNEPEPRTGLFLLPMNAPGVRVVETWDHLGMRATGSHDVVMTGVALPADHALDLRPPPAWSFEPAQFAWITLPLAALYDGIARGARDWLKGYLHDRRPSALGAPLATLPRMQSVVGEIEARLTVNRRLLLGAAREADAGAPPSVAELGLIKNTVTANAIEVVQLAVTLIGNPALDRKNPLERHLRDVLCARIHTPQEDSVLLAAGRAALGL